MKFKLAGSIHQSEEEEKEEQVCEADEVQLYDLDFLSRTTNDYVAKKQKENKDCLNIY